MNVTWKFLLFSKKLNIFKISKSKSKMSTPKNSSKSRKKYRRKSTFKKRLSKVRIFPSIWKSFNNSVTNGALFTATTSQQIWTCFYRNFKIRPRKTNRTKWPFSIVLSKKFSKSPITVMILRNLSSKKRKNPEFLTWH